MALEKDTLDVWVGGNRIETQAGFTEEGSEQIFTIDNQEARILGKNLFSKNIADSASFSSKQLTGLP